MTALRDIIRVLVADDHPVVRRGLEACFAGQKRVSVVGEAADGFEAVEKALKLRPDVVLLDCFMPRLDGLEATQLLRRRAPAIKVLVLATHISRDYELRTLQAGAQGCIVKEASLDEILEATESVYCGGRFFSPEVLKAAKYELQHSGNGRTGTGLTERERAVLALIANGHSNREISVRLKLAVRTVEAHRENMMRRLGIHTVAGLTKFAVTSGLVPLGTECAQS